MRSLLIEFHRFGKLNTGLLREGDAYLVAAASHPIQQVQMPIAYEEFVELMTPLRYGGPGREEALRSLGRTLSRLLQPSELAELDAGEFPLQLDLVVNAAELAALPFEMALDGNGIPLLVRDGKPIIVTRRVRGDFAETLIRWPAKTRLLFAWASPDGLEVPQREHEAALRNALASWIPRDAPAPLQSVLDVVGNASLESIESACRRALEEGRPFTHIHLLAHGYAVGQVYGLALHAVDGSLQVASPGELATALAPLCGHACVLTLAACDSANAANMIVPRRSIAHELHQAGFPVVIASQLPLTVRGSTLLAETFYSELLEGNDVRLALHKARCVLHSHSNEAGHDWASVVGYVRLPEGYAQHLPAVRLEAELTSLKAIQAWSDELVNGVQFEVAAIAELADLLGRSLNRLQTFSSGTSDLPAIANENLGLLGSAEKRLAELHFECVRRSGSTQWQEPMLQALERSRAWYRRGFEQNLSNHWAGCQQLSLDLILTGQTSGPGRWQAAVLGAHIDGSVWALMSLAELYLLASAVGAGDRLDEARETLLVAKERTRAGDRFPLESTARQLRRYVHWWTSSNGFFPGSVDLSVAAARLMEDLAVA